MGQREKCDNEGKRGRMNNEGEKWDRKRKLYHDKRKRGEWRKGKLDEERRMSVLREREKKEGEPGEREEGRDELEVEGK